MIKAILQSCDVYCWIELITDISSIYVFFRWWKLQECIYTFTDQPINDLNIFDLFNG